jgi:hypothetical protein
MYTYLTIDEFKECYKALDPNQQNKIVISCNMLCRLYRLTEWNLDSGDLFNEGFTRFLSGSRKLPKEHEFVKSFTYALKSIAQELADKKSGLHVPLDDVIESQHFRVISEPSSEQILLNNEAEEARENQLAEVMTYFEDDLEITQLLTAKLKGMKAREIVSNVFCSDENLYSAVSRRYRRKIGTFLSQRNHDE